MNIYATVRTILKNPQFHAEVQKLDLDELLVLKKRLLVNIVNRFDAKGVTFAAYAAPEPCSLMQCADDLETQRQREQAREVISKYAFVYDLFERLYDEQDQAALRA